MNTSMADEAAQLIVSSSARHAPLAADPFFPEGVAADAGDYAAALSSSRTGEGTGASVHVHLPFCPTRCLSCDHNTVISHDPRAVDAYLDALEREFSLVATRLGGRREVAQLHIGGGTPNYLSDAQLVRLAALVEAHFTLTPGADVSLEASPVRASAGQLELLVGLGFNAIHFELRDLDPAVQQAIGRSHSLAMLHEVFACAREAGMQSISMDILYGLPGQTVNGMRETVAQTLSLQPDRVSCHPYSRRIGTFPHQRAIDPQALASLGDKLALFDVLSTGLEDAGYRWIGLEGFVRDGDPLAEAQREGRLHRTRIGYTRHATRDLLGFGTGAISEVGALLLQNLADIELWQTELARGVLPVHRGVRLDHAQRRRRDAMTHLLCNLKLAADAPLATSLQESVESGLIQRTEDGVTVTPQGRIVLHHLMSDSSPVHRWDGLWRLPLAG